MTLTGLLSRKSAPSETTDEVAAAPAESLSATAVNTVVFRASAARTAIIDRSHGAPTPNQTTPNPIVRFDPMGTSEYPALNPWTTMPVGTRPSAAYREPYVKPGPRSPLALRITVGVLVVLAASAIYVERTMPKWLPINVATTPAPLRAPHIKAPAGVKTMTLVASSATASVYKLPVASYALDVEFTHPIWVMVKSLPGNATIFTQTLEPGAPMVPAAAHGTTSITVAAQSAGIVITSGGKTVGTIANPIVGHTYILQGVGGVVPTPSMIASLKL